MYLLPHDPLNVLVAYGWTDCLRYKCVALYMYFDSLWVLFVWLWWQANKASESGWAINSKWIKTNTQSLTDLILLM